MIKILKEYRGIIIFSITVFIMLQFLNANVQEINKKENSSETYIVEKR